MTGSRAGRLSTRRLSTRRLAAGAFYVFGMAALAAVAAWPIYRSAAFAVVVIAAVVAGAAIAVLGVTLAWRGWMSVAAAAAATLVLGMFLAVPSPGINITGWPGALADVLRGAVWGWKDLITVELPVGSYRNLLVPALIVFLVGTVAALRLAWSPHRRSGWTVAVGIAMVVFGIAFGRPVTSAPLVLGQWQLAAPTETLVGVISVLFSLAWLAGHAREVRRGALTRAASSTGVRVSRRRQGSDRRRAVLAVAMVAGAVVIGAVAGPALAQGKARDVFRAGADPVQTITRTVSPLSQYRSLVTTQSENDVLFRVSPSEASLDQASLDQALPDRVRIATLTAYDGEVYRALDEASDPADARFIRVPSSLDAGPGDPIALSVTIDQLRGIWMPTAGRLRSAQFAGVNAASLADSFYYNPHTQGAVQASSAGLRSADSYTLTAVSPTAPALATISSPGSPVGAVAPPDSLVTWLQQQGVTSDGAGLAEAVSRLRARGYLSHALSDPGEPRPRWMQQLEGYSFRPSAAGHSLARIDTMFSQLLEREASASAEGAGSSLVATVGDDEQFAVATALIAEQLGFTARVVVGVRLDSTDPDLPVCEGGTCRATDLSAWVEVRSSQSQWVSVDVTPQHAVPTASDLKRQRDPEVVTEVVPETAEEVTAPDPSREQASTGDDEAPLETDLSALWAALRIVGVGGLGLLIVLGPFAAVLIAKAARRTTRRREDDPSARILGGWEEYVDAAVDSGHPSPGTHTRTELAGLYRTPRSAALASDADRAAFSQSGSGSPAADQFWVMVDEERRVFGRTRPWWRRALAAVSLKSFTRSLVGPSRRRRSPSATK